MKVVNLLFKYCNICLHGIQVLGIHDKICSNEGMSKRRVARMETEANVSERVLGLKPPSIHEKVKKI